MVYRYYNKENVIKILKISSQYRTSNNGFKIKKGRFKKEIRNNWFSNRLVDEWNRLGNQVVCDDNREL